jgi:mRNA interferase MazF
MVRIEPDAENGLEKTSAADAFQVRSLAQQRFVRLLGKLSGSVMREISQALAVVLSID